MQWRPLLGSHQHCDAFHEARQRHAQLYQLAAQCIRCPHCSPVAVKADVVARALKWQRSVHHQSIKLTKVLGDVCSEALCSRWLRNPQVSASCAAQCSSVAEAHVGAVYVQRGQAMEGNCAAGGRRFWKVMSEELEQRLGEIRRALRIST